MQNTPFNGAGRRPAPHPLLAIIPSPTAIYLYSFNPLCVEYVCVVLYKNMKPFMRCEKERKSTCSNAWVGRAGSLPPPPAPLAELWGGGGLASHVLPGDFEQGRGDLWRVNSASYSRGWIWQIFMARLFGGSFWRICLAGHFGTFIWRVSTSNEKTSC